ncbi:MAG: hypothetical protein ACREDM_02510 [Methylocella sp.]
MKEPVLPLPVRRSWPPAPDAAPNMAGKNLAGRFSRTTKTLGSLALAVVALYKTFTAPFRCLGHHVSARGAGCLAKLCRKT